MDLIHLRATVFEVPLAIHPAKFDAIMGAVGDRFGVEVTAEQIEAASQPFKSQSNNYTVQDGIAIIPINGSLMKKTYGLLAASGCSSYEGIGAQIQDAINSPSIKGVLLDINSPGGSTSGLFELADTIHSLRGDKPIYAVANDAAYSAAYALASCADRTYITRTGGVGSIGVFCCHVDQSGADAKAGLKYTFIHAGDKKTDGNPHQPLSESALSDTQAEVDREYEMFVSPSPGIATLQLHQFSDTEAGVYFGETAVPLLADKVGTVEDALSALTAKTQPAINTNVKITKTKSGRTRNLNTHSEVDAGKSPALKAEHEKEEQAAMAKKIVEPSIDELVAKHATEAADEEEMEKDCKADAKDGDPDDDEDEDEEDEDEKKKPSDSDEEAKKGKKAEADSGRADAVRIVNLCTLAGMPALASTFLVKGFSVSQVEKALLTHRADKTKKVKIASGADTKPVNDFASVAKAIMKDNTIKDKAAAYRDYLTEDPKAYLTTMLQRENGQSYTFLKKRGY